jgi:hypothetical protein
MRCAIWPTIPVTVLLAACATSPAAPPPPVAPPAVATATTAAATAPGANPTPEQLREAARHAGYLPRTVKGQLLYCRDEGQVGTRFSHSVCLSEEDLKTRAEINQQVKDYMRLPASLDPAGK